MSSLDEASSDAWPSKKGGPSVRVKAVYTDPRNGNTKSVYVKRSCLHSSDDFSETETAPYTQNGLLRESHGRMFDGALKAGRYVSNQASGLVPRCLNSMEAIYSLPAESVDGWQLTNLMWTYWDRRPKEAGYSMEGLGGEDLTICEFVLGTLYTNRKSLIRMVGLHPEYLPFDGPKFCMMFPRFVRSLRSWGKERIFGDFWVVRDTDKGTLMVDANDFSKVYLAKGITEKIYSILSRVASIRNAPVLSKVTMVPLFKILAATGQFKPAMPQPKDANEHKKAIAAVDRAVASGTVITMGASAAAGKWDEEPAINCWPKQCKDGSKKGTKAAASSSSYVLSKKDKKNVEAIKVAAARGIGANGTTWVIRRMGYTEQDNPEHFVGILELPGQHFIGTFAYPGTPSYTATHVLTELRKILNQGARLPSMLLIDDYEAFGAVKKALVPEVVPSIKIVYYPPPSAEEEAQYRPNY